MLAVLVYIIIIVISLIVTFEIFTKFNHDWQVYMKIPGPSGLPFFGNIFELPTTPEALFKEDVKRAEEWPKIYKFPLFHHKIIVVYNAEDIEFLISGNKTIKPFIYGFISRWLGTGLLVSTGNKWHQRRKMLTPAFHFKILQNFLKVFHDETKNLTKVLHKKCDADYLNILPIISEFTLQTINDTAMGITAIKPEGEKTYKQAIHRVGELVTDRLIRPWYYLDCLYKLTPYYREQERLVKILHRYTDAIIKMRRDFISNSNEDPFETEDLSYGTRKRMAMLDLLLSEQMKGNIDDEGIREEVDTFMFEGHDTVSMAICYSLLVFANNKDVQDELRKEIYDVLGDNDTPDFDHLNHLNYMDRCIKEVLRLYPSVPFIFRETTEEGTSERGTTFPKQAGICIAYFNLHRDPDVFPNPEEFDPDRFLPENCKGRHPYAYLPFSAGPRSCIGQRFAILEMKAVLCGILREFELEPIHKREDIVVKINLVLRPNEDGIRVKFVPRTNKAPC